MGSSGLLHIGAKLGDFAVAGGSQAVVEPPEDDNTVSSVAITVST